MWLLASALFLIGTGCSFLYYLNVQDDVALADALQSFPHDRCWSDATFGKPVSIADHQVYEVTQEMCEASQTNWGGEGMDLGRVADHLFSCDGDRGLSVYVVGGSITCGAGKVPPPPMTPYHGPCTPASVLYLFLSLATCRAP